MGMSKPVSWGTRRRGLQGERVVGRPADRGNTRSRMPIHPTSTAIPTASTRERRVPSGIALQCAWCLDWIHEIRAGEVPPTVAVSHGLCSDCVGRLNRSEAKADASPMLRYQQQVPPVDGS